MQRAKELKKEQKEAETLGGMMAHLNPDEFKKFRDSVADLKTKEGKLYEEYFNSKIDRCVEKEKKIEKEMLMRGDPPRGVVGENILRSAIIVAIIMLEGMIYCVSSLWKEMSKKASDFIDKLKERRTITKEK